MKQQYYLPLLCAFSMNVGAMHIARQGEPLSTVGSSSTTTSSASTPTSSESFQFDTIPQLTTCVSATIDWTYSGTGRAVSLAIQSSSGGSPVVLTEDVNPSLGFYTWSPVNLPSGNYYLIASRGSINSEPSNNFNIVDGTNTSCIQTSTSSTTSSTPSSASSPSSQSSSSSSSSSSALAASSSSSPSSSSSSHVPSGAIAGGIIGGLIAIAAIFGLCLFCRIRRRYGSAAPRSRSSGWNGLQSNDSALRPVDNIDSAPNRSASHVSQHSQSAMSQATAVGGSEEDLASVEAEKLGVSSYAPNVQSLPYNNGPRKASSSSTRLDSPTGTGQSPPTSHYLTRQNTLGSTSELHLASQTNPNAEATKIQRHMSLDTAKRMEMIPMTQTASGNGAKRTARKAVPQYTPEELGVAQNASVTSQQQPSPTAVSPTMQLQSKPMHYLMPDMPPPAHN